MNYYNEHDPFAAAWLRELIAAKLIAPGVVDERSIEDISPHELKPYTQCHFFAGIGGWPQALRLAGWPDDRPCWTGSAPCQPYSAAGKRAGHADERHLWPAFFHLIAQCKPAVVFGEQVEAAIRHGWLDLVQDDLEGIGYAFAAAGLPAASVGAPHLRARLFFVADAGGARSLPATLAGIHRSEKSAGARHGESKRSCAAGGLADTEHDGGRQHQPRREAKKRAADGWRGAAGFVADTDRGRRQQRDARDGSISKSDANGAALELAHTRLGHASEPRLEGFAGHGDQTARRKKPSRSAAPAGDAGFWSAADWLYCRDEKYRPVEAGTFPLAHGIPSRVGKLRGYGNAIVPQVAQAFVESYLRS